MVTNLEMLLLIICGCVIIISLIMIWKVLDDCKKRRIRREKQRAARTARHAAAVSSLCTFS